MIYLIVYDRKNRSHKVALREYAQEERDAAMEDRLRAQLDNGSFEDVEVVLLEAKSLRELEETHGRYFKSARTLASEMFDAMDSSIGAVARENA